jgi:hypothetical protein
MTRWILAAMMVVGMGAFGATTASATDWDDVQDEWRDYQRELARGDWRGAQREYRDYQRTLHRYNRQRGVYFAPAYGVTYTTGYVAPTTVYYSQPYGYQQTFYYSQPYYIQRPAVAVGGGVTIWR